MSQSDTLEQTEQALHEHADLVTSARAALATWGSRAAAARAELEQLEGSLGELALTTRDGGQDLTERLRDLRDRVTISESAEREQARRVPTAEQAYLLAVADLIEVRDLAPVQARLADHTAATGKLVAELVKLEGVAGAFVPHYVSERDSFGPGDSYRAAKSQALRHAAARAEQKVAMVRELAERGTANLGGASPMVAQDLPAEVWGPDALVSPQQFLASLERAAQEVSA